MTTHPDMSTVEEMIGDIVSYAGMCAYATSGNERASHRKALGDAKQRLADYIYRLESEAKGREGEVVARISGRDESGGVLTWYRDWLELGIGTKLYTSPQSVSVVTDNLREAIREALGDARDCTRVWSAWSYGTMGEGDFKLIAEDDERVEEIASAALEAVLRGGK